MSSAIAKAESTPLGRLHDYLQKQKIPLERVIPGGMYKFDEIIGAVMLASRKVEGIAKCNLESVLVAVMDCVALGLMPHWGARGEAALVPFAGTCTLIVGYRGFAKLFYRSNVVKTLDAGARYQNDFWRFERRDSGIYWRHREVDGPRGELLSTFASLYMKDEGFRLVQARRDKIEKIKSQVLAKVSDPKKLPGHPWNAWFEEMAIKTAIREAAKLTPTYELERAIEKDDEHAKMRGENIVDSPGWREDQETIAQASIPAPQRSALPAPEVRGPAQEVVEAPKDAEKVAAANADREAEPDPEREAIQAEAAAAEAEKPKEKSAPAPQTTSERDAPDRGTSAFGLWILDGIAKAKDLKALNSFTRFDPGVDYPAEQKDAIGKAFVARRNALAKEAKP